MIPKPLLKSIKDNDPTFTSVDLSFNDINDKEVMSLAKALKDNNSLTSLDLSYNFISDSGALALVKALRDNMTLTYLDLGANNTISAELLVEIDSIISRNRAYQGLADLQTTTTQGLGLFDQPNAQSIHTNVNLGDFLHSYEKQYKNETNKNPLSKKWHKMNPWTFSMYDIKNYAKKNPGSRTAKVLKALEAQNQQEIIDSSSQPRR